MLLVHFGLPHAYGGQQDALQLHRAIGKWNPVGLKYSAWKFVTIYVPNRTYELRYYYSYCIGPQRLRMRACFFSVVTIFARHGHVSFMLLALSKE